MKRGKPPTPAMTPGTQAIYRPNDFSDAKKLDQSTTPAIAKGEASMNMQDVFGDQQQQQYANSQIYQQQQQQVPFAPPQVKMEVLNPGQMMNANQQYDAS